MGGWTVPLWLMLAIAFVGRLSGRCKGGWAAGAPRFEPCRTAAARRLEERPRQFRRLARRLDPRVVEALRLETTDGVADTIAVVLEAAIFRRERRRRERHEL